MSSRSVECKEAQGMCLMLLAIAVIVAVAAFDGDDTYELHDGSF